MTLESAILDFDENDLGEFLRALTFPGEGVGCYSTFDVRSEAMDWHEDARRAFWIRLDHCDPECVDDLAHMGQGHSYRLGALWVDVCWYWDGDGTLAFDVKAAGGARRLVVNNDCKKDYGWADLTEEVIH